MKPDDTAGLLWEGREPSRRGPRPALTLAQIAKAGVGVADTGGLGAVSMQAVAAQLRFTKMSLYRYVRSKDELLAIMIEQAVGDPPQALARPWRAELTHWAKLLTQSWQAHPWLPFATLGARSMGPREVGWVEAALAPLTRTRLTPAERLDAVSLLFGHLRNTQTRQRSGTQPWQDPDQRELVSRPGGQFPALAMTLAHTAGSPDHGQAFGLDLILDGIEALHDSRSTG